MNEIEKQHIDLFYRRFNQLRNECDISSSTLSQLLGQNSSYINQIENRKAFPSLQNFFKICAFYNITPEMFFHETNAGPIMTQEFSKGIDQLSDSEREHVLAIIKDINKRKSTTQK